MGKRKVTHWLTSVSTNIRKKLERLLPDKSPGPDEIHPMLLTQCAAEIASPLADIYQRSFNDGVSPKEWKLANISPIFKKGNKCDAGNYRLVCLTSVPCKVMETIIKKSLATFLDDKSEMSKLQHGFTKGRSCLTNLLESFEAWTRLLEEGYGVDIIYLDYRKALIRFTTED